jgi:sulfoacetaldehyde dehydrogenase
VVATGSQANVRAAYTCGTPAFGVGAGNVAGIVDESADLALAAARIVRSKTFDNATAARRRTAWSSSPRCASRMLAALRERGALLLDAAQKAELQALMWPDGKLSAAVTGQSARVVAERAGLAEVAEARPRILIVDETGTGPDFPFSGEKLCPVLTLYTAPDFDAAAAQVERIYAYQGAGHSVGLHTRTRPERALRWA